MEKAQHLYINAALLYFTLLSLNRPITLLLEGILFVYFNGSM